MTGWKNLHLFFLSFAVHKVSMHVMKDWEGFLSAAAAALTGHLSMDNEGTLCTEDGQINDLHPDNGIITQ